MQPASQMPTNSRTLCAQVMEPSVCTRRPTTNPAFGFSNRVTLVGLVVFGMYMDIMYTCCMYNVYQENTK
jgi:hypothetical protein